MSEQPTVADRSAPTDWLAALRGARSIAVVGASEDRRRPGGRAVAALLRFGFEGEILPVNPKRTEVQGLRCFPDIEAVDVPIDIAFVLVAADDAVAVVRRCTERGVPLVVVGSAGFRESGEPGRLREKELAGLARPGTRVIGPNTNGVVSLRTGAVACFSPTLHQPGLTLVDGPAAIVAHSGALGAATFTLAQAAGLDVGLMVNTGNEVDLGLEEVLVRLCRPDSDVEVLLAYVEGISDPAGLLEAARAAARNGVVLVMLKVGNSDAGAAAAAAHTAKLAGSDRTFDGVLRQLGVVRAAALTDLTAFGVSAAPVARLRGRRVTVATLSGGLGVILADALDGSGLEPATWSTEQQRELGDLVPDYLSRANPLDLGGGPFWNLPVLQQILTVIDEAPGSHATILAIANFEGSQDEITDALVEVAGRFRKPLFVVWFGSAERSRARLNRAGIPAFAEPVDAVRVLSKLARRHLGSRILAGDQQVDADRRDVAARLITSGETIVLDQAVTEAVLRTYDIPVVAQLAIGLGTDPAGWATFPCYVKLSSPELTHKSDAGGVVPADSPQEMRSAIGQLQELARTLALTDPEIILQERVDRGAELLLGMAQDPVFGAVLTLGLGGVLAEALDDVAVRLPVVSGEDVRDMLAELRHRALVAGFRGLPAMDGPRVVEVVLHFAELVHEVGDRLEAVDLNPVIVGVEGQVTAVDMLMVRRS